MRCSPVSLLLRLTTSCFVCGRFADGVLPYMLSKLTAEIPLSIVQMLLQFMFIKLMSDLQGDYFQFVAVGFGLSLVASSLGMLLGAVLNDVKEVTECATAVFIPQILFIGFYARISQIPVFLRWAQYLCAMSYATKLGYYLEFNADQRLCQASPQAAQNCANLLAVNNATADTVWGNAVGLVVLFVAVRVLTAIILVSRATK
jgi:hypothetical protein